MNVQPANTPHPEERPAGPRLEGWTTQISILRDARKSALLRMRLIPRREVQ
jgi:hypothetical protein